MATAAKRTKEQQVEIDDLKERLKREIAAHEAKKEEIASLRDNLASEMANLQQVCCWLVGCGCGCCVVAHCLRWCVCAGGGGGG
jgi:uncharacterized protein YukE